MKWTKAKVRLPRVPDNTSNREPILTWYKGRYTLTTEHPSWWNWDSQVGPDYDGQKVTYWARLSPPRAADKSSAP